MVVYVEPTDRVHIPTRCGFPFLETGTCPYRLKRIRIDIFLRTMSRHCACTPRMYWDPQGQGSMKDERQAYNKRRCQIKGIKT